MNGAHHKLASNVDIDRVLIETSLFITVSECIYPFMTVFFTSERFELLVYHV